jgi:hypothetical protein
MDWITVVATSLFSGIIGIVISNMYHKRSVKKKQKYDLLEQMMGNRFDLTGDKFSEALNKVFIVFNDSQHVLEALKSFHESVSGKQKEPEIINQRLLELFKSMCDNLKINTRILTDSFYLKAFNIKNK